MSAINDVQIIIPMTGNGSRFKTAGYEKLKPFITVHGIPMIEWVVRMFPGAEKNISFLCRDIHLDTLDYMRPTLESVAPHAKIERIGNWEKLGPVNDTLRAASKIKDEAPVIICYCDFYMQWDFEAFMRQVLDCGYEGAVPCYGGFHPHLLVQKNIYASCKTDDNDLLIEIKEKFSWTSDKTKSWHSPGLYYFRNGALMKHYLQALMESGNSINGEYYASMPYNTMVADGLRVWCPNMATRFCQWGTPEDLQDYLYWVETLRKAKGLSA